MTRSRARARLAIVTAAVAAAAPLVPLAPAASAATSPVPRDSVVYAADTNDDFFYGIYMAPASSPTTRTPILAESTSYDVQMVRVSPDGTKVAATIDTGGQGDYSLEVIDVVNGTPPTLIAQASHSSDPLSSVFFSGFDWSRDSSTLVYNETHETDDGLGNKTDDRKLYTRLANSTSASGTLVSGGAGLAYPSFNQAGTRIAATKLDGSGAGVYVVDPGAGTATQIATAPSGTRFRNPTWSPDDSTVAVALAHAPDGSAVPTSTDILLLDPAGSSTQTPDYVTPVSNSHTDNQRPFFAMDGSLWFDTFDANNCCSGDLFRAIRNTSGGWTLANRTSTTTVDEGEPTFPRPVDDGAPTTAVVFQPFGLAGTTNVVRWTPPAGTPDYSYVTLHRAASDASVQPADIDVHGTSYNDNRGVTLGVTYTYTAVIHDGSGNAGPISGSRQVTAMNAPKLVVANPTSRYALKLPFTVTWGVSNPGPTTYDVDYTVKTFTGGVWTAGAPHAWKTATAASSAPFTGSAGQTYYFRATLRDTHENVGVTGWAQANVPLDQTAGTYSTGWTSIANNSIYWLGSIRSTSVSAASATFTPTSKSESLIGDKCATCGSFRVYVDGKLKGTFSSKATGTSHRQILWTGTNSSTAKHTVKIVAVLAKGQVLRIDGLADPR